MEKKELVELINGDGKVEFIAGNLKIIMPSNNPGKVKRIRNLLIKEKKIKNIFKK